MEEDGTLVFPDAGYQIIFPFGVPAADLFFTDLSQVRVLPLDGFPGPGVRIEPEPGTWAVDGNGNVSTASLFEITALFEGENGLGVVPMDQVWYTIQTTTTYQTETEDIVCETGFGGEGGFVDGTLDLTGYFPGPTTDTLSLSDFSAPPERAAYRNNSGFSMVLGTTDQIDFGDHEDIELIEAVQAQVGFTATDCGTDVPGSAEIVAIELRFVDGESLPADADGDGYPDEEDAFPDDPEEWLDTDSDGVGNNADTDDDGDGVPDQLDDYPLGRFDDAAPGFWAFPFIEALARSGITAGCGGMDYCPDNTVTRAQMAVFLERGMKGSGFVAPAASGNVFLDVDSGDFAANFIEQLFADGITSGCGGNNYCPNDSVTRGQMAVFLLRAMHGQGYTPPPATGQFGDVDLGHPFVAWIEQLEAEGITSGCGGGNYCPGNAVTRAQMAVFLVRAFDL